MNPPKPIRILIADDHAIVREGLAAIIAMQADMELVGEAENGRVALTLAQTLQPNVILLDMMMPELDGLAVIQKVHPLLPATRILVLTSFADDQRVFPAIKAGALGYLLKDTPREQLLQAIRDVAQGQAHLHPRIALKVMQELSSPTDLPPTPDPLTERELSVLRLIARGLSNQEIAAELTIHERTVAKYVSNILDKLHLANRTQAALYALREGLASL
jgi:NarL family two-component system response regulator LiaR